MTAGFWRRWFRRERTAQKVKDKRESEHQLLATEGVLTELEKRVANIERERRLMTREQRKPE